MLTVTPFPASHEQNALTQIPLDNLSKCIIRIRGNDGLSGAFGEAYETSITCMIWRTEVDIWHGRNVAGGEGGLCQLDELLHSFLLNLFYRRI